MDALRGQLDMVDLVITTVATLAAAFFGVWYAFKLQRQQEYSSSIEKNLAAANLALFQIIRAHNTLLNIKSQIIAEHETDPYRHHFMKPALAASWTFPEFNYEQLAFLLNSDSNLLGSLSLLQQDISGTYEIIRHRSQLHCDVLQPAVEEMSKKLTGEFSIEEIEAHLGIRFVKQLQTATDYMIDGVGRGIESTERHAELLKVAVRDVYPGRKLIGIVPADGKTGTSTATRKAD